MATPNYSYEKRQRELAKKRKTEEKRQRKTQRGDDPAAPDNGQHAGDNAASPAETPTQNGEASAS